MYNKWALLDRVHGLVLENDEVLAKQIFKKSFKYTVLRK